MIRYLCSILVLALGLAGGARAEPQTVVLDFYYPDWIANPTTLLMSRFLQENRDITVKPFSNLKLPVAGAEDASKLMAFAGGIAPDVNRVWFHKLEPFVRQGFVLELSEWIGQDTDGDGYISDAEAKCEEWKRLSPAVRRAATIDGKPYALPVSSVTLAMIYRRDLVREITGREEPPRSYAEFLRVCQQLCRDAETLPDGSERAARRGYFATADGFKWVTWLWAAGGEEIMQGRVSPVDGRTYWFAKEVFDPRGPAGEDLARVKPEWKMTFASEAGLRAMDFQWQLMHQPWIRDPATGAPVNLTREQETAGTVTTADGRTIAFEAKAVFHGVSRGLLGDTKTAAGDLFRRGEVAFAIGDPGALSEIAKTVSPAMLGVMPVPSPEGDRVSAFYEPNWWICLNSALAKAPAAKRAAAWRVLTAITGDNDEWARLQVARNEGLLRFADPELLRKHGMDEYVADVPAEFQRTYAELKRNGHTEPFVGYWLAVQDQLIGQQVLGRMLADPNFDYRAGLRAAEEQANTKVMRGRDEAQMRRLRPRAWAVFAVAMAGVVWLARQVWRGMRAAYLKPGGGPADRVSTATWLVRALPWLFIGPALALLLMWTYYPLAQGATMAFQDYKILAAKSFVGLDNFITVLLDPKFYKFLWITVKFVVINLLMGFVAPIALAIMLNEIPRGKLLFRMLFLLPQVSSGLVIAFIWRMMYYPSEAGFFNALLLKLAVITKPLQFLNDPSWALLWVTLPAVWAGLGGGSLIYLAALKSVSDDLYEAADVDGAGAWRKLIRITLPSLMPIILINFVGTFIGLFKSMGNIFLMTGGGPGDETTVISLSIWRDSFLYLQFGTATATAWVLAALLASFTVVQLRILSRVEFRKAEE